MALNAARIFVVRCDNWEGLYVNGALVKQDLWIGSSDIMDVINEYNVFDEATSKSLNKSGVEWVGCRTFLPAKLSDIPLEYFGH